MPQTPITSSRSTSGAACLLCGLQPHSHDVLTFERQYPASENRNATESSCGYRQCLTSHCLRVLYILYLTRSPFFQGKSMRMYASMPFAPTFIIRACHTLRPNGTFDFQPTYRLRLQYLILTPPLLRQMNPPFSENESSAARADGRPARPKVVCAVNPATAFADFASMIQPPSYSHGIHYLEWHIL